MSANCKFTANCLEVKVKAICILQLLTCSMLCMLFLAAPAGAKKNDAQQPPLTWEMLVKRGNDYMARDRMPDARKFYRLALKILEDQQCDDLRKAVVLHDLAETYRFDSNWHQARMNDLLSSAIYQKEVEKGQLGPEYSHKNPVQINSGSLRPACLVCHENWKVVPILYGTKTGYDGPVPKDSDPAFTHKPGGDQHCDQRWYCKACHQNF